MEKARGSAAAGKPSCGFFTTAHNGGNRPCGAEQASAYGRPTLHVSSRARDDSSLSCASLKLMTDAAPAPVMAANDELIRLRAENEELRKKNDELQDVNRDLWDENEEHGAPSTVSTKGTRAGSTTRGKRAWPA